MTFKNVIGGWVAINVERNAVNIIGIIYLHYRRGNLIAFNKTDIKGDLIFQKWIIKYNCKRLTIACLGHTDRQQFRRELCGLAPLTPSNFNHLIKRNVASLHSQHGPRADDIISMSAYNPGTMRIIH